MANENSKNTASYEQPSIHVDSAVQMRGVTKTFGSVIANDKVDLEIRHGEILSLLGENGSGKTTLTLVLTPFPNLWNSSPITIRMF